MMDTSDAKIAQSTAVVRKLLEVLPLDKVIEFRVMAINLHKQQLALIDEILEKKGYKDPNVEPIND